MKEDLRALVNSMNGIRYSFIPKCVSMDEALQILEEVGNFIWEQQKLGYAVYVNDLGLFTVFQQKILVSNLPIKYIITRRPVFQLSHRLASKFRIRWSRQIADNKIPQKILNPSTIAIKCKLERSKVILCLNELVTFMEKSLKENKSVQVPVHGVGTLKISEDEWKMEFKKEYLKSLSMDNVLHVIEDL